MERVSRGRGANFDGGGPRFCYRQLLNTGVATSVRDLSGNCCRFLRHPPPSHSFGLCTPSFSIDLDESKPLTFLLGETVHRVAMQPANPAVLPTGYG